MSYFLHRESHCAEVPDYYMFEIEFVLHNHMMQSIVSMYSTLTMLRQLQCTYAIFCFLVQLQGNSTNLNEHNSENNNSVILLLGNTNVINCKQQLKRIPLR